MCLYKYDRTQAATSDLRLVVIPRDGFSFHVVRQSFDATPRGDAVTLVPRGPKWLHNVVHERIMALFDRVERIGLTRTAVTGEVADHFPRFPHLKSLFLSNCELSNTAMEAVGVAAHGLLDVGHKVFFGPCGAEDG